MTTPNPQPSTPPIYPDYCHALSPTISRWAPLRAVDIHSLRSVGMFIDGREVFHFSNHPIKWARVTGVVVAIDEFSERRILTVDDSSGACVECVCACPAPADPPSTTAIPAQLDRFKVRISKPGLQSAVEGKEGETEGKGKDEGRAEEDKEGAAQPSVKAPQIPWGAVEVGSVVKVKGQIGKWREMKQVEVVKIDIIRGTEQEVKCWEEVLSFRQSVLSKSWVVTTEEEDRCREKALHHPRKKKGGAGRREVEKAGGRKDGKRDRDKGDEVEKHRKRRRERDEGLDPANKINYPSMAVRMRVAGKYDALGI